MDNPINSVTSRIQGMQTGNLREPEKIGEYRFHLMFDSAEAAQENISTFAPFDTMLGGDTIATTNSRPNMYLVKRMWNREGKDPEWVQWNYWEYVEIEIGFYGRNYYLFGNGKVFTILPEQID